jgi:hypothetical protein
MLPLVEEKWNAFVNQWEEAGWPHDHGISPEQDSAWAAFVDTIHHTRNWLVAGGQLLGPGAGQAEDAEEHWHPDTGQPWPWVDEAISTRESAWEPIQTDGWRRPAGDAASRDFRPSSPEFRRRAKSI